MEKNSSWANFDGTLSVHTHASDICQCPMQFAVFTPPQASQQPVPVLWYLSGLTCTWANVMEKSGLQRMAAELGLLVVAPDTSPRGEQVADDAQYDLGQGAGFYLTATQTPWSTHYRMDQYIVDELSTLIADHFPADMTKQGVFGHSMGGHGALTLHLKHPQVYRTISAFAPITSPMNVPWGEKAFSHYLGPDRASWAEYDATELVKRKPSQANILVDTGTADPFLDEQLQPQSFIAVCKEVGQPLDYRMREGYDHSYYFIATFIEQHLRHHAAGLA